MPSLEKILGYLRAVFQMMTGRREALYKLDLSADGFWESFWAIAVALPPLCVSWASFAKSMQPEYAMAKGYLFAIAAVTDLLGWLLPVIAFVLLAQKIGLGDRIANYVVASNWGSALFAWFMWPPAMIRLAFPNAEGTIAPLELTIFLAALVFSWRLTDASLQKGPAVATAVFIATLFATFAVVFLTQGLLLPAQG